LGKLSVRSQTTSAFFTNDRGPQLIQC